MIFSSSTSRLSFQPSARVESLAHARPGDVVVAEILTANPAYPHLEQPDGSFATLNVGDRIVGALGSRSALRGFVGTAPESLVEDDTLALLNMGGVIGRYVDSTAALGEPASVRYVGTIVDDDGTMNLNRAALPVSHHVASTRPIILTIGSCMNVGKTTTIAKLIESGTRAGYRIGAAKLAGVAALRDLGEFERAGAVDVKSFLDCGLPSTVDAADLAPVFKAVVNALDGDLVIVELGDGIVGHYHVGTVLADADIMSHVSAVVLCAGDMMAAYGAKHYLDACGVQITAFSGCATDNVAGSGFLEEWLGIPAVNGLKEPDRLFATLELALHAHGAVCVK